MCVYVCVCVRACAHILFLIFSFAVTLNGISSDTFLILLCQIISYELLKRMQYLRQLSNLTKRIPLASVMLRTMAAQFLRTPSCPLPSLPENSPFLRFISPCHIVSFCATVNQFSYAIYFHSVWCPNLSKNSDMTTSKESAGVNCKSTCPCAHSTPARCLSKQPFMLCISCQSFLRGREAFQTVSLCSPGWP